MTYRSDYEESKDILVLSDTEIFYYSRYAVGSYYLDLIKAEFTDSRFDEKWHQRISCQTSGCSYGITTSALDSNTNSLWHGISFESTIFILNQDILTGVQIGPKYRIYKTSDASYAWDHVISTTFSNQIAYFYFNCDPYYSLMSFNTTSRSLKTLL